MAMGVQFELATSELWAQRATELLHLTDRMTPCPFGQALFTPDYPAEREGAQQRCLRGSPLRNRRSRHTFYAVHPARLFNVFACYYKLNRRAKNIKGTVGAKTVRSMETMACAAKCGVQGQA